MTSPCKDCGEAPRQLRKNGTYNSYCSSCGARRTREWRLSNLDKWRRGDRTGSHARHRMLREIVVEAKDRPCVDCGIRYPYFVMDFDHVRGEKLMNVGRMVQRNSSVEALETEIAKCEVVCANCHRLRTFSRVAV